MNELTAWYDTEKREVILKSKPEIFYYMIHASNPMERIQWAHEYFKAIIEPSRLTSGTNKQPDKGSIQE